MYESSLVPDSEARARVEVDVSAALGESFTANAQYVKRLEDGTEQLTLYVEPRPSVIARVDVDKRPIDDEGTRVTIMRLTPIARPSRSGGRNLRVGNGQVNANAWRLTEVHGMPPKFEIGQVSQDGTFALFDDDLMNHDETVASFGGYWPANLRQGIPENPLQHSRGLGRIIGRAVLKDSLPALDHKNYYR